VDSLLTAGLFGGTVSQEYILIWSIITLSGSGSRDTKLVKLIGYGLHNQWSVVQFLAGAREFCVLQLVPAGSKAPILNGY